MIRYFIRRIITTIFIFLMVWGSVLAHDGSDHVSQLEQWVAGGGIVLILIALIYRLLSDWLNRNKDAEQDYRSNDV